MNDIEIQFNTIENELSDRFLPHHNRDLRLSRIYEDLEMPLRADRVLNCGTQLEFLATEDLSESPTLHHANFCKDRLCSMCAWRRSLKVFGQVSQVMDELQRTAPFQFVFVSLTVRNCSSDELKEKVNYLQRSFDVFRRMFHIKRAFLGYFKALEITRNPEQTPDLEYHPHLHCIFAVDKDYFTSKDYISHTKLCALWKQALGVDYYPQVDIRKIRPEKITDNEYIALGKAVAEVAKYAVKSDDYLDGDPITVQHRVLTFLESLTGRRLCSFGGIFKDIARQLDLDDLTDGDLVHTDNLPIRNDIRHLIIRYEWRVGFGYQRIYTRYADDLDDPPHQKQKKR